MITKKREIWIDIVKAICIISMVVGHIGVPFVTYIYMFHMVVFFVLSGYTYNGEKYTWLQYVVKKIKTLIIPMFVINILYLGLYAFLENMNLYEYVPTETYSGFINGLKGMFSSNLQVTELGGGTWFLIVLFWAEIIFKTVQRCINNAKYDVFLLACIGAVGYHLSTNAHYLPFTFDLGLYACLYFASGVILKRYNIIERFINFKFMVPISVITMYGFNKYYFNGELPMNWPTRTFANPLIQMLIAWCGFILCYYVGKLILKNKIFTMVFSYIGKHTMIILNTHFLAFKMITFISILIGIVPVSTLKIFPIAPEFSKYWFVVGGLTIAVCIAFAWLAGKTMLTNYIFNGVLPNGEYKNNFLKYLRKKYFKEDWMRYILYFFIIIMIYMISICFVYPGKFSPLVPHHSDILDYPYDYECIGDRGIYGLFSQTRPIGLLLTGLSGVVGGYKGVMIVGAICTFACMLLMIVCVEKQLNRKCWIPAIILYVFCIVSSPSFYLNYTFDLYNVYALFFGMISLFIWYAVKEKKEKWEYPLVFFLTLCGFLCKETYIITFCGVYFLKIFLEKGYMKRKAKIYFGINCLAAGVALLQAKLVNSVFAAMAITDVTSPYYSSVEITSMLKTAKFYLQGFDNPWLIILLLLGILSVVMEKGKEGVKCLTFVAGGLAAYIPYLVLPNRTIPHSFFVAYIITFMLLLTIHPNGFKTISTVDNLHSSVIMVVILFLLSRNSIEFYKLNNQINSYAFADVYRMSEPYMEVTLRTSDQVNEQLRDGDKILVKGLETQIETAFRANSANKRFRDDVMFFVLTDYLEYTGPISTNVEYISEKQKREHSYDVEVIYTNHDVKIIRNGL